MSEPTEATWRIGVDEAGYGPNLGPLVVAASAWRTPPGADLDTVLASAVAREPTRDERLLIADSKAVYQPGGGLAKLEQAVYAALGEAPGWNALVDRLGADPDNARTALPWHEGFDPPALIDLDGGDLRAATNLLSEVCEEGGVEGPRLAARLVYPGEFNRLVDEHGTKGAALSFISIGLAKRLYESVVAEGDACEVVFDKHGGRNRYAGLLQEHFDAGWVEVLSESRPESRYRQGERLAFRFRSGGEEELPVALASMTAKLLREISMQAFNAYWTGHVPGLKPTAGYPVDAKRFKSDIAAKQAELGIHDETLWRSR
ncbi:Hypothetical protein MalM25_36490 [Planctomycetes bacterium MalM25]|nr:Hypothetical protein MalM25_36490 [Planctomycetes bacterium MalM25]